MKKIIGIICLMLALCLVACSSALPSPTETKTEEHETEAQPTVEKKTEEEILPEGPHDATGFAVGFARVVANPPAGTGLGGFANNASRVSAVIQDDIMITCICISDGESKVLLYSLDTLSVSEAVWNQIASQTQKKLGIPRENIILNCTHTHSAPQLSTTSLANMKAYMKLFYPKALEAATRAVADLDRCEMKIGRAETDGLNYVRRYLNADGTYAGGTDLSYGKDPALFRHETEADEEMQVIVFDRVNQKDVVLCNWQCHTTSIGSSTGNIVSADWVYPLRTAVEEENDVHFSFHQGAGGNLVPGGKFEGENKNGDYHKHGKAIAAVVKEAVQSATPVESGKISTLVEKHTATVKDADKAERGKTDVFQLVAFSIGDVSFVTAPFEMCHELGQMTKKGTPYKMTFVCAYSNGSYSYVPAEHSWANGGYEVRSCHYLPGEGERVVQHQLTMLQTLYEARS